MDAFLLVQKLEGGVSILGVWEYEDEAFTQAFTQYFRARQLYVQHWGGVDLIGEAKVN